MRIRVLTVEVAMIYGNEVDEGVFKVARRSR
jgi:hypothetical protein